MIRILENGCNQMGLPNWVQYIIIGVVIIGAVAIDRRKRLLQQLTVCGNSR